MSAEQHSPPLLVMGALFRGGSAVSQRVFGFVATQSPLSCYSSPAVLGVCRFVSPWTHCVPYGALYILRSALDVRFITCGLVIAYNLLVRLSLAGFLAIYAFGMN